MEIIILSKQYPLKYMERIYGYPSFSNDHAGYQH
jgi:hypothetical protein